MKFKLSLKIHFFSCFYLYLIFLGFIIISYTANALFSLWENYAIIFVLSSCLFSLCLGIYEYSVVLKTYLNFHSNTTIFWYHSIIVNIVNTLILLSISLIINLVSSLLSIASSNYLELSMFFVVYLLSFSSGAIGYISIYKVRSLAISTIILFALIIILFGKEAQSFLYRISSFNNYPWLSLVFLITSILLYIIIYIRIKKFIK